MIPFNGQAQGLIALQQLEQRMKQLEEKQPEVVAYRRRAAELDAQRVAQQRQAEVAQGANNKADSGLAIWEEYIRGT